MTAWFFEHLYEDHEFCAGLGKAVLAAGEFESALRAYLESSAVDDVDKKATLGRLLALLKRHGLVGPNHQVHIAQLTHQRNYLVHSLFDLYSDRIEESLLPRDVVPEDVDMFRERANVLAHDLRFFTQQVQKRRIDT